MAADFPTAVPEIPVDDLDAALDYYARRLGFRVDWGGEGGGIAGISQGNCRLFLTNAAFRELHGNHAPVVIWLNVDSKEAVDALHERWRANQAEILAPPESKPWGLHEFIAADPDGNRLRVFYDFGTAEKAEEIDGTYQSHSPSKASFP
ncbi:MAG TPA: VOC family protein [Thermoanaerobaculia bacterium]